MLEAAVSELKGEPIHSAVDPELTIEEPGFIPDDYVPDPGQRLELYKRLSAVIDDDEVRSVLTEISDRYGPVPGEVILLGELMGIKAMARRLGVVALEISSTRVAIVLPENSTVRPHIVAPWRRLPDGRFAAGTTTPALARQALLGLAARATGSG
jgi:transcription-repair coupling factor (superfamily II helicase)